MSDLLAFIGTCVTLFGLLNTLKPIQSFRIKSRWAGVLIAGTGFLLLVYAWAVNKIRYGW